MEIHLWGRYTRGADEQACTRELGLGKKEGKEGKDICQGIGRMEDRLWKRICFVDSHIDTVIFS